MADLDRVAQLAPMCGAGPGALGEPFAAVLGECRGGLGVPWQK